MKYTREQLVALAKKRSKTHYVKVDNGTVTDVSITFLYDESLPRWGHVGFIGLSSFPMIDQYGNKHGWTAKAKQNEDYDPDDLLDQIEDDILQYVKEKIA